MTRSDLAAIKKGRYVQSAFNSLGIHAPEPRLTRLGLIVASCDGIDSGDSRTVAERLELALKSVGWKVTARFDAFMNTIVIENENESKGKDNDSTRKCKGAPALG